MKFVQGFLFFFSVFFLFTTSMPARAGIEPDEVVHVEELLAMSLEELIDIEISLTTGTAKPLRRAPAIASVITAADIERMGATTLDEALETVPGLHVGRSFARVDTIYSIRGIHTNINPQVLLLFNGLPITLSYSGGRPAMFRMPVANISRIEVIRGPGSAVHGADAFSGTINVITKNAHEINGSETGMRAGSFDTFDTWL